MLFGLFSDKAQLEKENEQLKENNSSLFISEANARTENLNLKADNLTLMGRVSVLEPALAKYKQDLDKANTDKIELASQLCEVTDVVEALKAKLKKRRKPKKSK